MATVLQAALDDVGCAGAPARAIRQIRHENTLRQLEVAQSMAELRSGARGSQARKALINAEKDVSDSFNRWDGFHLVHIDFN